MSAPRPVALIILDGFGYREITEDNAITAAKTPTWDKLWSEYPSSLVQTSGIAVGLPEGQMGNSEVGHMNLGAGRVIYQNLTKVSRDIENGDFFENQALCGAVDKAKESGGAVHILGLMSPGGVHSHEEHIAGMVELAAKRGASKVYVHAFLDGRDTPPRSAEQPLRKIDEKLAEFKVGYVASVIGRYFAMDRDNRWDRVQQAYDLLVKGEADVVAATAVDGLHAAYEQDKNDEFVPATSIRPNSTEAVKIEDGDSVIFMNFRPDRARELTRAFTDDSLNSEMDRSVCPKLASFVTLTQYAEGLNVDVAYPPETFKNTLGEYVSSLGKKQLRIAETEKYAHVTFFFSGGEEAEYEGESRILIPSPNVATYDLQPEMSAPEVTEKLVGAIDSDEFDLIVCNFANGDMVGHTGVFDAAVKAVETLDESLKVVTEAILAKGGACLITADHGNVEMMKDAETGEIVTSHTTCPVPLVLVQDDKSTPLKDGRLCDIAPTLLTLMGDAVPAEMEGESLIG